VCNKLLARVIPGSDSEVKCPRCKSVTHSIDQFSELLHEESYEK